MCPSSCVHVPFIAQLSYCYCCFFDSGIASSKGIYIHRNAKSIDGDRIILWWEKINGFSGTSRIVNNQLGHDNGNEWKWTQWTNPDSLNEQKIMRTSTKWSSSLAWSQWERTAQINSIISKWRYIAHYIIFAVGTSASHSPIGTYRPLNAAYNNWITN